MLLNNLNFEGKKGCKFIHLHPFFYHFIIVISYFDVVSYLFALNPLLFSSGSSLGSAPRKRT